MTIIQKMNDRKADKQSFARMITRLDDLLVDKTHHDVQTALNALPANASLALRRVVIQETIEESADV